MNRPGEGKDTASNDCWNNRKDQAYLWRTLGDLVDYCDYNSAKYDYTNCE